jgi:anti-sigma factor RsiW
MNHAREIELIELTAGRLDPEREKIVLAHVEDCPACRTKLQEIRTTWNLLGAWEVQPARQVNVAGPAASLRAPQGRSAPSVLRFPGIRMAVRVAAVIIFAVLAGYESGRWSIGPAPAGTGTEPPPYFSALGFEVGDSFSPLVLQDEPSSSQES